MRIDVADEGYAALRAAGREVRVFLDGVEQQRVVWADEEAGELFRYEVDADGKLVRDGDEVASRVLRGVVKVYVVDRCPKCLIVMNGPGVQGGDCLCVAYEGPR